MRIALVVPGGVDRGGENRVIPAILWLMERLARTHDVHVIVPNQEPDAGAWDLLGARVHNMGANRWRFRAVRKLVTKAYELCPWLTPTGANAKSP